MKAVNQHDVASGQACVLHASESQVNAPTLGRLQVANFFFARRLRNAQQGFGVVDEYSRGFAGRSNDFAPFNAGCGGDSGLLEGDLVADDCMAVNARQHNGLVAQCVQFCRAWPLANGPVVLVPSTPANHGDFGVVGHILAYPLHALGPASGSDEVHCFKGLPEGHKMRVGVDQSRVDEGPGQVGSVAR